MLTKDEILSSKDIITEVVPVPEWGGDVIVSSITASQRDRYEQEVVGIGKGKLVANLRARLVSLCIVDEEGKRMFNDTEVVRLGNKSAAALCRIFDVCQSLNGFTSEDVEELEKNSESDLTDGSVLD